MIARKNISVCQYDKTSIHFNAIFHGSINSIFEMKICNTFTYLFIQT